MTPEISVIIPVYNVEKYIIECLESVVSQDIGKPVEIIVADDCGTDRSMELVDEYRKSRSTPERKIRVIRHEHNEGQSAGRNNGIKAAEGKYLFFMDSDDYFYSKEALRLLHDRMTETGADFVFGEHCCFENGKTGSVTCFHAKSGGSVKGNGDILDSYLEKWEMIPCNKLINKEFITSNSLYFPSGIYYEDNYWAFTVALKARHIEVIPQVTYAYRQHSDSTVHTFTDRHYYSIVKSVRLHYDKIRDEHLLEKYDRDTIVRFYERFRQNMFWCAFRNLDGNGKQMKELFLTLRKYNIAGLAEIWSNRRMLTRWKKRSSAFRIGNLGYLYLCGIYKRRLRKMKRK